MARGGRIEARGAEAIGQRRLECEQLAHQRITLATRSQRIGMRERVAHLHRLAETRAVLALAQQRLHEMVTPRRRQEIAHRLRQRSRREATLQHDVRGGAGLAQALAAEARLRGALLLQFDAAALLGQQFLELGMRQLEHRDVFVELCDDTLGDRGRALEQVAVLRRGAGVVLAGLGEGVEQAARGMHAFDEH